MINFGHQQVSILAIIQANHYCTFFPKSSNNGTVPRKLQLPVMLLHLNYDSGKLFTMATKDNCLSFVSLIGQLMFLVAPPLLCKSSWYDQTSLMAHLVWSRATSHPAGSVKAYQEVLKL